MSTSREDEKASCGKNEERLSQCVEKNVIKVKTVRGETSAKNMTTTKKNARENKRNSVKR